MKLADEQKVQLEKMIDSTSLGCLLDAVVDQINILADEAEDQREYAKANDLNEAAIRVNTVSESLANLLEIRP